MERYKVGIDVGGTFTDFLVVDPEGDTGIFKTLTTKEDPSIGVFQGLQVAADYFELDINHFVENISVIVHGTTITTNAVLTGEGARTGFITTEGFRDVLNLRRGLKENQYDCKRNPPSPLVPRYLVQTVRERINCEGSIITSLEEQNVYKAIQYFKKEKVEAIAVSLLFSFYNASHEKKIEELIRKELPEVYLSISSDVLPQIRLYERNSTTVLNSYTGPILSRYIGSLINRLKKSNFSGILLIMQSNGGVMSPEVATNYPVNTLLSGPAGGPKSGLHYAGDHGIRNIITMDMGGTSFDVSLIKKGLPNITTEGKVGGHSLSLPMMDIHTIGAGGGSIVWIDEGGILRVGPQSAGSSPGPVCYAKGGTKLTVTDADLILGYLSADFFCGGKIKLNYDLARRTIKEQVSDVMGLEMMQAAYGIYKVVNTNMAAAVRVVSVRKGYDPREFALIVAGGAGPIHAGMIANEIEAPIIIIPKESSVFCAAGMLISDLEHDYVQTYTCRLSDADLDLIRKKFSAMTSKAVQTLKIEGVNENKMRLFYSMDLRYVGQFNEVRVPVNGFEEGFLILVSDEFHKAHDLLYGYSVTKDPLEVINLRLKATGLTEKPKFREREFKGKDASFAMKGRREAYFDDRVMNTPVYDGHKMGFGNEIIGPAIIELITTTIVTPPMFKVYCDNYDNFIMFPKGDRMEWILEKVRGN